MTRISLLLALAAIAALLALALMPLRAAASSTLPASWVELGGKRFGVELALDNESRARGLMHRAYMADDHGMLFVHDYTEPLGYWMKNTLLSLDILYFDENRRLVTQQLDVPPCRSRSNDCPVYPSSEPARYVLELNAGVARALNLQKGDQLVFGPGIPPRGRGN